MQGAIGQWMVRCILYYIILYYTILYYTILYYTILYYTILHYIVLHRAVPCASLSPARELTSRADVLVWHSEILQYLSMHFASTLAALPNLIVRCAGVGLQECKCQRGIHTGQACGGPGEWLAGGALHRRPLRGRQLEIC